MRRIASCIDSKGFDRTSAFILAGVACVLLLTFAAYRPGLTGTLLTDDVPQLKGLIDNSGADLSLLIDTHLVSGSGPFGRSVAMATFIGDAVTHGPDIWWWKFDNVMYHLIAGLLVFWLTGLLARALGDTKENHAWAMAAVVASFWLLHPLHVSTVLYTVQRMTELSTLFVLAGLVFYVKGRGAQQASALRGWMLIAAGFCIFFPLALLSKESALLFPVYCSLIEVLVFRFKGIDAVRKQLIALHGLLLAAYVSAVVYTLSNFQSVVLNGYAARDFTLLERLLTQPRVVVSYLGQLLRPIQSKMGFFHDDLVVSTGLFSPMTTIVSIIILLGLAASAIALRNRLPLYAFGILFFFSAHALESTVFPLELMFEHRNHLASFGIVLAIAAIAVATITAQRAKVLIVVLGLCGLSFLTWQRAVTWASAPTMYDFMYYAHPNSTRLNYIFADVYSEIGDYTRARQYIAIIKPDLATGIYELQLDCLERQEMQIASIDRVIQIPDQKFNGHVAANIKRLAESVLDRQCPVPERSLLPLLDHLLTLPHRNEIDRQVVRNFRDQIVSRTGG